MQNKQKTGQGYLTLHGGNFYAGFKAPIHSAMVRDKCSCTLCYCYNLVYLMS